VDKHEAAKNITLNKKHREALRQHEKSVECVIRTNQKALVITQDYPYLVIEGPFYLFMEGKPFDSFEVKIVIFSNFPKMEPIVVETGKRIQPRTGGMHINPDGTCCFGVWELWLHNEVDQSVERFLNGIVHSYFVQQIGFEINGTWPIGEMTHYEVGLFEAFTTILGFDDVNRKKIRRYLDVLSLDWPKGHIICPCGSTKIIRNCCRGELEELHSRVTTSLARRMKLRLSRKVGKEYR